MNHQKNDTLSEEKYSEALDYNLEWPAWSLDSLKSLAVELKLPRPLSLAWAVLLNVLPPPNADFVTRLKVHRNNYEELRKKYSRDPRVVVGDDPLSQNEESVWKQHFSDEELKALILQDVTRTFPDEPYFREKDVQDMMVRVLFTWSRAHIGGYKQGMHEVLAPLMLERCRDHALAPPGLSDSLKFYLKEDCLEHDSHMLFSAVMRGLERFYSTGDVVPSSCGRLPVSSAEHSPSEVVRYLARLRSDQLAPRDPALASHLEDCNISLELFGIRWLRLLFGREFPRAQLPSLWGFLFAEGPSLPNLHLVVIAMLISMRSLLLDEDPGSVLAAVMRPLPLPVRHVVALARHLQCPLEWPRPTEPDLPLPMPTSDTDNETWSIEELVPKDGTSGSGSSGVAEGADVARELAALALLRRRLPAVERALRAALPVPPPSAVGPLAQLAQLSALLQCRNHDLIDVETALEAAEGDSPTEKLGRRQIVPVSLIGGRKNNVKTPLKPPRRIKEYQLKVFHQSECVISDNLPFMDPLRLRTE